MWPVRRRLIASADVLEARRYGKADFRREFGYGMRIGAGGLWGGFGLLRTGRVTFSMWVSRLDEFVVVQLRDHRPLLLTPSDPMRFVAAIEALRPREPLSPRS